VQKEQKRLLELIDRFPGRRIAVWGDYILDEYLFDPGYDFERGKRYLLGAAAFDRENGLLYIVERMADEAERSLIHVFQVSP